jgi:ankyrin repeat protein
MGFRAFSRRTVFISCSRDMAGAAAVARASVERVSRRMPAGTGWDVFHWEKSDSVWTSDGTWQEHIPRPSDPNCGVVICLFGERVGEVLPGYFPWPEDLAVPPWVAWPEPVAGRSGVTGTLFELIDALHGPRAAGTDRRTVAIFKGASDRLRGKALDPASRKFGFEQEYDRLCEGAKRPPRDVARAYDDQIDALDQTLRAVFHDEKKPFYCFGRADASPQDTLRELDALFERILPELLGAPRADASRREPKGLFSYSPDDHPIFFGRDAEVERALTRLERLAADSSAVPMLLLSGRSGEGKSSVMRAGLTGRLGAGLCADRCGAFVAVDRTVRSLVLGDPLLLLAEALEAALGAPLFDGHGLEDFVETARAGKLAAALGRALGARPGIAGHQTRVFLGLDQLDDVVFEAEQDATLRDRLRLLLATVGDLCRAGLAWSVLTIPADVIPRLEALVPGLDLPAEALRPPGEDDLHHLISRSFAAFRLPPEDVPRLHDEAVEWLRGQEHPGPILPLISALMAEMKRAGDERRKASVGTVTPAEEAPLTLAGVLDRLGERAWAEVTRGVATGWDERLGRLLRQLVVTRIGGGATRGLRNCPLTHPAVAEAGPLVAELQRQRFLYRPDGHSLRLSHEAIVGGWARARTWYEGDRQHQVTLAEIEPKAERWQAERLAGRAGRVLTDLADLEAAALLWMNYCVDTDLLPVDFLRASLSPLVDGFRATGDFLGPKGLNHFRAALVTDDADLVARWRAALEAVDEPLRRVVIDHVHPETGKRTLTSAATWGSSRSVAWLLESGADPMGADRGGWTPLHGAAWRGRVETVRRLLDRAEVDARTDDGWTALHLAAANGHAEVAAVLLERAEVDARTDKGVTPLHLAAQNGHAEVAALLLERGEVDARTDKGWTPLHLAAQNGHAEVAAQLLDRAEVDARGDMGWTPLHRAAANGHAEVAALLLDRAEVDARTDKGFTPLHLAATMGDAEVVTLLLASADIDARMDKGFTPLHSAALNGNAEVAALLLDRAEVNARGDMGFTPLHLAAANGQAEVAALLLDRAEVDARGDMGLTPLHLAAANGQTEVAALLLGRAEVDARTDEGETSLHLAVTTGHAEVATLLLDKGACPHLANAVGDDPSAFAIALGRELVMPRLREKNPDLAISEAAARRLLGDPEKGVLNTIGNAALGLPADVREALKEAIRAAAPESFDAFCDVLEAAVLRLGGDPRYEIARLQAMRRHPPAEAEAMARAAVAGSDKG